MSYDGWGLAVICLRKAIRSESNQLVDTGRVTFDQSPVQCSKAFFVSPMHTSTPVQEELHNGWVSMVCGPHETCVTGRIGSVYGYILMQ